MATTPPGLHIVPSPPATLSPGHIALEAALNLVGLTRGAIIQAGADESSRIVASQNLSPEEEAACVSLAGRLWQTTARGSALTSRLGNIRLIAESLLGDGDGRAALVVLVDPDPVRGEHRRLDALHDVAILLAGTLQEATVPVVATSGRVGAELSEERQRSNRVPALHDALLALANAEDVRAACVNLLQQLLPQLPGTHAALIWLLDAGGDQLSRLAAVGMAPKRTVPDAIRAKGLLTEQIIGTDVTSPQAGRDGRTSPVSGLARRLGLTSLLCVPLRSRNATVGALMLGATTPRSYTSEEMAFLQTLGTQLGGQLDAMRHFEAAQTERERLQVLIDTLPAGVALFDVDAEVRLYNHAIEEIWGHGPVKTDPEHLAEAYGLLSPEGRPLLAHERPITRAMSAGVTIFGEELRVRQTTTGREIPVLVDAVPVRDPQGRLAGVLTVFQDITRLREVDTLKDSFINTVSHELRTPTTTVRAGALTLLKRGDQLEPEVSRQLLRDIADEAERLYHLVEDLLSLTRAQAGMQLHTEPIIVHRFVNKVILDLGGRVGNHTLTVDVPDSLPLVEADPECLDQILRNLFENAAKFSPKGKRIRIAGEPGDGRVLFSISDRGSGIPPADMDKVFEPFYKTADALRTGSQGAGLGLAVCRRLVEVQGGKIWAEPRPGGGTIFRFTLPTLSDDEGTE